ncbi:MAG TPA: 50S ribosomal protein L21 [Candidatus Marinimicrobia bacterium]|nr:50S ribosomal protein L21 [Candidatus Neomarinimicrobiota bacterium]
MYAIIEIAKKQFSVSEGDKVKVPLRTAEAGSSLEIADVLAVKNGEKTTIGTPFVKNALVKLTVLEHGRDKKIIVFKKKRRKGYKKTIGHRQHFSIVKVDAITTT